MSEKYVCTPLDARLPPVTFETLENGETEVTVGLTVLPPLNEWQIVGLYHALRSIGNDRSGNPEEPRGEQADASVPLLSCTECLACDLTGRTMDDCYTLTSGEKVDEKFGHFVETFATLTFGRPEDSRVLTGQEIADALDDISSGTSPWEAACNAWRDHDAA